jgi:predicted nucleic acid-binding protein
MGDRGNIQVIHPMGSIYLYTHWGGSDVARDLARALDRARDRWDDEMYLTRIIFCEMIRGEEEETTGYGIGLEIADNEHEIPIVDVEHEEVFYNDRVYSFDAFMRAFKESA